MPRRREGRQGGLTRTSVFQPTRARVICTWRTRQNEPRAMTAASVIHPSTALRRVCPSGTGRGAAIASRPVFAARSEPADADCCSAGIGAVICWRLPPVRSSRWVRCASQSRQRCFCRAQPSQGPAWRIRIVCTDLSARRDTASGGRLLMGANLGLPTGLALEIPRRVSDSFSGIHRPFQLGQESPLAQLPRCFR